jgi:hypothetical protein
MRMFNAILVTLLAGSSALGIQNKIGDELAGIRQQWNLALSVLEKPHSWAINSEFVDQDGARKTQKIAQWKDGERFSHVLLPEQTSGKYYGQTWTFNEKYAFYAEPLAENRWALMQLRFPITKELQLQDHLFSDRKHFELYFRSMLLPLTLRGTMTLQDIGDHPDLQVLGISQQEDITILKIRWNIQATNEIVEIEATLDAKLFHLPTKVVGRAVYPEGPSRRYVISLSDFKNFGNIQLPTKAVHILETDDSRTIDSSWELVSLDFTKPNAREFMLEKFGLTPPDAALSNNSAAYRYYSIGFVCLGVLLILFLRFGVRRHSVD